MSAWKSWFREGRGGNNGVVVVSRFSQSGRPDSFNSNLLEDVPQLTRAQPDTGEQFELVSRFKKGPLRLDNPPVECAQQLGSFQLPQPSKPSVLRANAKDIIKTLKAQERGLFPIQTAKQTRQGQERGSAPAPSVASGNDTLPASSGSAPEPAASTPVLNRNFLLTSLALPCSGPFAATGYVLGVLFSNVNGDKEPLASSLRQARVNFFKAWCRATPVITARLTAAIPRNAPYQLRWDRKMSTIPLVLAVVACEQVPTAPFEFWEIQRSRIAAGGLPLKGSKARAAFGRFNVVLVIKNIGPATATVLATQRATGNVEKKEEDREPTGVVVAKAYRDGYAATFPLAWTQQSLNQAAAGLTVRQIVRELRTAATTTEGGCRLALIMSSKAHALGMICATTAAVVEMCPENFLQEASSVPVNPKGKEL